MGVFVKNLNASMRFCLRVLKFVGFLKAKPVGYLNEFFFNIYWFSWFMFLVGGIIIAQTGAMFQIWGDITLMTSASFLLFTNLAFAMKIINVVMRRQVIQGIIDVSEDDLRAEDRDEGIEIVKSCNRETTRSLYVYILLSFVTISGWASSAGKNQLPLTAWYPYDSSKSPAYELTYMNQELLDRFEQFVLWLIALLSRKDIGYITTPYEPQVQSSNVNDAGVTAGSISSVMAAAVVNVCLDTLVTSLIAVCRCRLRLVGLSLRTLCDNIVQTNKQMFTTEDEAIVQTRLKHCAVKHEAALQTAAQIQACFSLPILAQFSVSVVIICVTAYQLAIELINKNWVRIISMVTYLLCMMLQVFLYCYQGNQLTEECSEIAEAAYSCPWYMCSVPVRRALLIVMVRTRRLVKLTAGGFTTLSLACFTSIIKASYTFFTVLKQVDDRHQK